MSEKIIIVQEGKIAEKDGKDWVELTDMEGKLHRIFRSIQNNEGTWVHLDKEVDMLKAKIEDGSINELAVKLIKEKKGTFWNVLGVEIIKDEFIKQAAEKVQTQAKDNREDSIEAQTAQKGGIEILKVLIEQALLTDKEIQKCKEYAATAIEWGLGRINLPSVIVTKIEEAKGETAKTQATQAVAPVKQTEPAKEVVADEDRPKTIGEMWNWVTSHGKEFTRTWARKELAIPEGEAITPVKAKMIYETLKQKMGW